LPELPGIPSIGEFVPGFEAMGWQGIGAPRNTPADVISKLNQTINAGLASPVVKARLAEASGHWGNPRHVAALGPTQARKRLSSLPRHGAAARPLMIMRSGAADVPGRSRGRPHMLPRVTSTVIGARQLRAMPDSNLLFGGL
jgi:hypothetical protein